ncbi:MAG: tetraacyldisaccharide 4'-kinase, partial [Myxococcota bacterium]
RLARDLDIVVLRPNPTPDLMRHLPWGTLREGSAGLRRADVVWFHGPGDREPAREFAGRFAPRATVIESEARWTSDSPLEAERVVVVTGIARPERVAESATAAGADVVETIFFPDHHRFLRSDEARIARRLKALGGPKLLTTAKDAVKMVDWKLPRVVADIEIELASGHDTLLRQRLAPFFGQHPPSPSDNYS